MMMSLATC